VFLDGGAGSGKQILSSLLPMMRDTEIIQLDLIFESLALLYDNDKIEEKAAQTLLNTYADAKIYDACLGRHSNFRFRDISSVFWQPNLIQNIFRIFRKDDTFEKSKLLINEIQEKKLTLNIVTHFLMCFPEIIFSSYSDRAIIIEIERHPVSLFDFWKKGNWIYKFGKNLKDLSLWHCKNNEFYPWFIDGEEEKYDFFNEIDKIVFSLYLIYKKRLKKIESLDKNSLDSVILIKFEEFVKDPSHVIKEIEKKFNKKIESKKIKKFFKKENLPRQINMDEFSKKRKDIINMITSDEMKNIFNEMCNDYESKLNLIEG
tara:strand:+ start:10001 stop:10948 length:948 start_codon:yes stop_codon:yes gene_type:complete